MGDGGFIRKYVKPEHDYKVFQTRWISERRKDEKRANDKHEAFRDGGNKSEYPDTSHHTIVHDVETKQTHEQTAQRSDSKSPSTIPNRKKTPQNPATRTNKNKFKRRKLKRLNVFEKKD